VTLVRTGVDAHVREIAAGQGDLVAAWQLAAAGWSLSAIHHCRRHHGWRTVHRGVYAVGYAPLTRRQLWIAATLTTPDSVLSHASAAACYGSRSFEGAFEVVTRPGSGGPRRLGRLLACRSNTLEGNTAVYEGIPITTPERTVIDLAAQLDKKATGRLFRETLRLGLATVPSLSIVLKRHPGARGTAHLRGLCRRYAHLPYARTRSDAEALALEVLHDAGVEPPNVNERIGGDEADLSWPARQRIIEIDGPQFHRFPQDDAQKQRAWNTAGYDVTRISSDDVYDRPGRLIEAIR